MSKTTIEDLPSEILEYIFCLLPPYKDVRNCGAVKRLWNEIAKRIIPRTKQRFRDSINSQNITWKTCHTRDDITNRYAHSACRYRDSMYVFGGNTSAFSSFNDLWELDLSTKIWNRLSVEGQCPVPKAGATMVTYGNKLILFGGMLPIWRETSYPDIHFQNRRLSNHIHIYDIGENNWNAVIPTGNLEVPGLAGHTATIHANTMIVFGGLKKVFCVNDVYSLDLTTMEWRSRTFAGVHPAPRFGHSQVFIDDHHLLILGGVTDNSVILDDVWLLDMSSCQWRWNKIEMGVHASLIKSLWCHSVCRVGKFIVFFKPTTINVNLYSDWFSVPLRRHSSNCRKNNLNFPEVNLNGKRGTLSRMSKSGSISEKGEPPKKVFDVNTRIMPATSAFRRSICSCIHKFKTFNSFEASIELHLLDLSHLLDQDRLIYVRSKVRPVYYPTETILYSVIEGNGELIIFGGIQRDVCNYEDGSEDILPKISNSLQIIKMKNQVI